MNRPTPGIHRGVRPYLTGFVLAVVLTVIPFALVAARALPRSATLFVVAAAAVVQMLVHLRYFLHLDLTSTRRANLVSIVFAALIVLIMVGGSLWIMLDLDHRMSS